MNHGIQRLNRKGKLKLKLETEQIFKIACFPIHFICRYLVVDHKNSTDTQWWNSEENQAAHIDFTNPAAAKWYSDRLKLVQAEGIDNFKFDAGETSWAPVVS